MNRFSETIDITARQFVFNFKQIALSSNNWLFFISFTIIAVTISTIFIPFSNSIGLSFLILLLPTSASVYAKAVYGVNNSTMKENLRLSNRSKTTMYISTILLMAIYAIILSSILYSLLLLCKHFSLLKSGWYAYDNAEIILNWKLYLFVLYSSMLISMLVFSISFVMQTLISNVKTYFVIILSLLVLCVIFGGAFNSYIWATENVDGDYVLSVEWGGHNALFPDSIWYFSILFPFYAPAQLLDTAAQYANWGEFASDPETSDWYKFWQETNGDVFSIISFKYSVEWTLTLIIPYLEILMAFFIGKALSIASKDK